VALRLARVCLRARLVLDLARRGAAIILRVAMRRAAAGRLPDFLFVADDFFFAFITANPRPALQMPMGRERETKAAK
jgi:hypothetical protein